MGLGGRGEGGTHMQDSESQQSAFLVWKREKRDLAEAGKGSGLLSHAEEELLNREAHC